MIRFGTALALSTVTLLASGCTRRVELALAEPLVTQARVFDIYGSNRLLLLGVTEIERTWPARVSIRGGHDGPWGIQHVDTDFEYWTNKSWKGSCAFASYAGTVAGFEIPEHGALMCEVTDADGGAWTLELLGLTDDPLRLAGSITNGTDTVDIRMVREVSGKDWELLMGYVFSVEGRDVAAIQVIEEDRRYWRVDDAPHGEAIMTAMGALSFSYRAVATATELGHW